MTTQNIGIMPSLSEFSDLQERFDFLPENRVEYPQKGAIISLPSEGKVGVPIPIFEAGLRLPMSDFFDDTMRQYGFSVDYLTPDAVKKIVGFKMACRALGVLPQLWAFKYFFDSTLSLGCICSLSSRESTHSSLIRRPSRKISSTGGCG